MEEPDDTGLTGLEPTTAGPLEPAITGPLEPTNAAAVEPVTSGLVEPVSAVIGRYLQKATTAPPTIRHFFKPKDPDFAAAAASQSRENDSVRTTADDDDDDDVVITKTCSDAEQITDLDATDQTGGNGLNSQAVSCKPTAKRSVVNGKLPAAKKPKQSSIAALFSSAAQKQSRRMQCPVCSRLFEETVSNAKINEHIDNCLIE